MAHRNLPYNPLFESLNETARRYERFNESDVSPEYKRKYAIEYGSRIIQLMYDQYVYFTSSIPIEALRTQLYKDLVSFVDLQSTKENTLKTIADSIMTILNNVLLEVNKRKESDFNEQNKKQWVIDAYKKLEEGLGKMEAAVNEYNKLYSEPYPEVNKMIQDFLTNAKTALEQTKK